MSSMIAFINKKSWFAARSVRVGLGFGTHHDTVLTCTESCKNQSRQPAAAARPALSSIKGKYCTTDSNCTTKIKSVDPPPYYYYYYYHHHTSCFLCVHAEERIVDGYYGSGGNSRVPACRCSCGEYILLDLAALMKAARGTALCCTTLVVHDLAVHVWWRCYFIQPPSGPARFLVWILGRGACLRCPSSRLPTIT